MIKNIYENTKDSDPNNINLLENIDKNMFNSD